MILERLTPPASNADRAALARLLVSAVQSGSAVSFRPPLLAGEAEAWWTKVLSSSPPRAIFLVARHGAEIVGTVQLQPAWAPNQPHRGDIAKLLVDPGHRGAGVGAALMQGIEAAAREDGFTLLTLDTKAQDPADRLYRRLGWTVLGTIPGYALDPDGHVLAFASRAGPRG